MNYKLITNENNFEILETFTSQVIKTFSKSKFTEAKMLLRHLNLGGAFDGNTPTFFLKTFGKTSVK